MDIVLRTTDPEHFHRRATPFLLWGIALLLFGVAVLAWPRITGEVLVALVGAAAIVAGLVLAYAALRLREVTGVWWLSLVPALLLTGFGLLTLLSPEAVSSFFLTVAAVLVILWGIGDIALAVRVSRVVPVWWVRLLRGVVLVAAGLVVVFEPLSGLVAVAWLVALWAVAVGALSLWFGWMLRAL